MVRLLKSSGHWYRSRIAAGGGGGGGGGGVSSFVTRSGSQLILNGAPFRCAGTNVHWVGLVGGTTPPHYPTYAQIDSVLADANAMNATVIRMMSMGINLGSTTAIEPTLGTFQDSAFDTIDYAISVAGGYGMKILAPLLGSMNIPDYQGDVSTWTNWRGLTTASSTRQQFWDAFVSDATVLADCKTYISHLLNHVNAYTGVAWKNDPTIMMWEIGNEIYNPSGWLSSDITWLDTVANYIRSVAPNHLIACGRLASSYQTDPISSLLTDSTVDALTGHYYHSTFATFTTRMQTFASQCQANNKVSYIGEFDWTSTAGTVTDLQNFLAAVQASPLNFDTFWQLYPTGISGDAFSLVYPAAAGSDTEARQNYLTAHAQTMNSAAGAAPGPLTPPVLA